MRCNTVATLRPHQREQQPALSRCVRAPQPSNTQSPPTDFHWLITRAPGAHTNSTSTTDTGHLAARLKCQRCVRVADESLSNEQRSRRRLADEQCRRTVWRRQKQRETETEIERLLVTCDGDERLRRRRRTWSESALRQEAVTMCPSAEPGALLASMSIASEPHRCGPYTRRVECRTRSSQKCTTRTRTLAVSTLH